MKIYYLLLFLLPAFLASAQQSCSVKIKGDTCINALIYADTKGGAVDSLIWFKDSVPVLFRYKLGFNNNATKYTGGNTGVYNPLRMCLDRQGNVYTTSNYNCDVKKWVTGVDTPQIVAGVTDKCGSGPNKLSFPRGIFVDDSGYLFVAESLGGQVSKFAPGSTEKIVVARKGLINPYDVFVDKKGNLFVLDYDGCKVLKFPPGATKGEVVAGGNGRGPRPDQLYYPEALTVDDSGNIYVNDQGNWRVTKWAPGATKGEIVVTQKGTLFLISDIAVDKKGNLFFTTAKNTVDVWPTGSDHSITVAGGYGVADQSPFTYPASLDFDSSGNLYVLGGDRDNSDTGFIYKFLPSNTIDKYYAPTNYQSYIIGNYSAKVFFRNGCIAKSESIYLNGPPENVLISGANENLCGGGVREFTATGADRANYYAWKAPTGSEILSGQGTEKMVLRAAANFITDTLFVKAQNGCGGYTRGLVLTTAPAAYSEISGRSQLNPQDSARYRIAVPESGVTYKWLVPSDVTILEGQGTNAIALQWGNYQDHIFTNSYNACGSVWHSGIKKVRIKSLNVSAPDNSENLIPGIASTTMLVYPNPATQDKCYIDLGDTKNDITITITDINGKQVYINYLPFAKTVALNISNLAKGFYVVVAQFNGGKKEGKLLIE